MAMLKPLPLSDATNSCEVACLLLADFVAKGFCSSQRVRLIQDQAQTSNVDSKIHSSRFDCCVFLFYSFRAATSATKSARNGNLAIAKIVRFRTQVLRSANQTASLHSIGRGRPDQAGGCQNLDAMEAGRTGRRS